MPTLPVIVNEYTLTIADINITFHRTLRIPDDGKTYPLPPSLGHFPIVKVEDYKDKVPAAWRKHGGVIIPMHQNEALWMSFNKQQRWRPAALKVGVGMVDALTGEDFDMQLSQKADQEQNYMVVPGQPWLDGIKQGNGTIRQFVAAPLGSGVTVEGQISGQERFGGVQLVAYLGKQELFPQPPPSQYNGISPRSAVGKMYNMASQLSAQSASTESLAGSAMGMAAGGKMTQKIYTDKHGVDAFDQQAMGRVFVHIVNAEVWQQITGQPMPHTPISAETYSRYGMPWYAVQDGHLQDIKTTEKLAKVKSVGEMQKGDWTVPTVQPSAPATPPVITVPDPFSSQCNGFGPPKSWKNPYEPVIWNVDSTNKNQ